MELIDYEVFNGSKNMEIDAAILDNSIREQKRDAVFRLYGWSPACISLGRNQADDFIDNELLKKYGIDCVRRLTGGRALLHDIELTYSYVTPVDIIPNGDSVTSSYKYISGLWIDIFKNLGIELSIGGLPRHITGNNYCMSVSTGADLCWNNKKFIGSAQCRKSGYILQHGSILLDLNKDMIDTLFKEKTDYETIVSLKEINSDLTLNDVLEAVRNFVKKRMTKK